MKKVYSEEDLIRFVYNDMEAVEYLEILYSLDHNPELKETVNTWMETKDELPKVQFSPCQESLNLIMAYSQL